jgi:hypothetical protein
MRFAGFDGLVIDHSVWHGDGDAILCPASIPVPMVPALARWLFVELRIGGRANL